MISPRILPTLLTFATLATLVTPYCGFLFNCGCTWPWRGLVEHCNFLEHDSTVSCPWCQYILVGIGCVSLSIGCGILASNNRFATKFSYLYGANFLTGRFSPGIALDCSIRLVAGVSVFLVMALGLGWLTAIVTDYPAFLIVLDSQPD